MNKNLDRCKHGVRYDLECDLCEAELTQTLVSTDTSTFYFNDEMTDEDRQELLSENEIMRHELQQIREYCNAMGVKNELNSDNTVFDLVKRLG